MRPLRTALFLTFAGVFFFLLATAPTQAKIRRDVGLNLEAGFPDLLGFQFRYLGLESLELGIGYGSLPIQRWLQSRVNLNPIPLDLQLADSYALDPASTFGISSFGVDARWFPFKDSGFFAQLGYQQMRVSASLSADLRNTTAGTASYGVVTGSVSLSQPFLTPALGYQLSIAERFYMNFALGVGVLLKARSATSIGGSLSNFLALVPAAEEDFENAKAELSAQVEKTVNDLKTQVPAVPTFSLGIGFAF